MELDQSKAEKGEGIFGILRRNGLEPSRLLVEEFIRLNQSLLGPDSVLIEGKVYFLPNNQPISISKKENKPVGTKSEMPGNVKPALSKTLTYDLFGPGYENVVVKDNILENAVFYLISGHGGPDPGAIGEYGKYLLSEDEYAYDVTLRLARNLMERGALVYMVIQDKDDGIRDDAILEMDTDEISLLSEALPYNQKARLRQRTQIVNNLYKKHVGRYQRLISIHLDSRSTSQNIDVFFYHHHRSKSGKKLADHIQQTFESKYAEHQPGRNYYGSVSSRSGLYLVRNTTPPIVFIELGNIQNSRDQRRFVLSDNRQALANWIMEGILRDFAEH
ncbi:MAG: N-acetylmuramoyl-L-alanine amidase family protein [Candidatus Cyclobacteriaceae bacterium M3_2C_046]